MDQLPTTSAKAGTGRRCAIRPGFGVADVFDPAENVRGGAQYLAALLKLFDNDLQLARAAYNAGEAAVLRHGRRIPPYPETAAYVPKVVDSYRRYRQSM